MTRLCNIAGIIFCIDTSSNCNYITTAYQQEVDIVNPSTRLLCFTRCTNSKCNFVFPTEAQKVFTDADFLCPVCRKKLDTFHLVQCRNCHSIVNFIYPEKGESPIVYYVRKCHRCTGTVDDERKLQLFYFPDLLL